MPNIRRLFTLVSCPLAVAFAVACSDANSLPDPTAQNFVDTLTLGALEGTPVTTPSGFGIQAGAAKFREPGRPGRNSAPATSWPA